MNFRLLAPIATALAAALAPQSAIAGELPAHPQAEAQTLDLAKRAIALRSVRGPGNKTGEVAALFREALVAGGFDPAEVTITPFEDTVYLIATWKGSDPALKPLVISGHMDVVAANPADWQRDPFTPVVENGYLFGRGASDMKFDGAMAIASLIELKRQGYKPRRSIVIEFSGDEETTMATSAIISQKLAGAELVLNIDGGGGTLDGKTGEPLKFSWDGAEKIYADYRLTVTNPGGHSSRPTRTNAINQLAAALVRIGDYRFEPEVNNLSRAYFVQMAKLEPDPRIGNAMRAFAADPADKAAIEVLATNPATVGRIGTTCVATMIEGGHALNALPQRASANINCRIFPGHTREAILAELKQVAAEPALAIEDVTEGSVATQPSPMRKDFTDALAKALHAVRPGVPIIPAVASGASDSMWFRHAGVPSYGASPTFTKDSEDFSHGLNERVPLSNIRPGIDYYLILFRELSR